MNFVRVEGFPDYVIHPCGTILKIWKNHTRELKHRKRKNGYMRITLFNNGNHKEFLIHRLLALHFIPNPENKPCIDHLDSVRDNNNLKNLEWVTVAENCRRRDLNNPPELITKGCVRKSNDNGWIWEYYIKGKKKPKL